MSHPGTTLRILPTVAALCLAASVASAEMTAAVTPEDSAEPQRNNMVLGCWGDADKGDNAELKLAFLRDGSLVQYDENQQERRRRTFGAWEMQKESTFLVVYWPNGGITRYNVKKIGRILHFAGMYGTRNFTLREMDARNCWEPKE